MFRRRGIPEIPELPAEPALVYPKASQAAVFVEFTGATGAADDDGKISDYVPRERITVNILRISGFYDHTILAEGRKIRVMETYAQIALKILQAMKQ